MLFHCVLGASFVSSTNMSANGPGPGEDSIDARRGDGQE